MARRAALLLAAGLMLGPGPAGGAPADGLLDVEGAPAKGRPGAPVTLVEFSDYQCPFCARHSRDTLPQLERDYIRPGRLRYVFRDFPIESIHPRAFTAHRAAHCAGDQGRYWPMHDRLFQHQTRLAPDDLRAHAAALGLSLPAFGQCLESGRHAERVRRSVAGGQQLRLRVTPTFLVGRTEANGTAVRVLHVILGAQPYPAFARVIDAILAGDRE